MKLKADVKYQSTFMDFLRGGKQETLSSVKNAPLPKKVVVPYIPPVVRKPAWKSPSGAAPNHRFGGDDDDVDADLRSTVGNIISKLGNDKDAPPSARGRGGLTPGMNRGKGGTVMLSTLFLLGFESDFEYYFLMISILCLIT